MSRQTKKLTAASRRRILDYLVNHFSLEELRTLCFNLGENYDSLAGEGREGKARELVSYLERKERIGELINLLKSKVLQSSDKLEPKPDDQICIPKKVVVIAVGAIVVITLLLIAGTSFQNSPFCSSLVFDTLDDVSTWNTFALTETTRSFVVSLPGRRNKAAAISYSLREGEWILLTKDIQREDLKETEGISFYYAGSGAPNTIEIKFFYENSAIFAAERKRATSTQGWERFEAPYTSFTCWSETGCSEKDKLNLDRVVKMDVAVSSKNGGEPGSGIVLVDDLQFIRPWSWMCAK